MDSLISKFQRSHTSSPALPLRGGGDGRGWLSVQNRRGGRPRLQACSLVLAIFLAGCAGMGHLPQERVLARVNGEAITVRDLEEAFTESHKGHGILLAGKGAVRRFLEKVIDKRLLLQEARRIGLDQDPQIQKAIEERKGKRAAEAFYKDEVSRKVVIPEEAILASYKRLGHRFQARHILAETREEAEEALDRIKGGEDFSKVARLISQAPTAGRGGYLGIVGWGQIDPGLEERLWALEEGQVSRPFETKEGWNLLSVIARVSVERPKLEEARSYIGGVLKQRETRQRSDALFRDLMIRWKGKINQNVLLKVLRAREAEELPLTTVVAEVGGERITLDRLLRRINLDAARQLPTARAFRQMQRLLEQEVFRILLRNEGLARGYGERPEISRELERLRGNLAVDRLLSKVVFAKLQISDEAAEAYYQAHTGEFIEPEAVQMRTILVESEDEAMAVMAEFQVGKDFAIIAKEASKDRASAELGGETGWIRKGQVAPEIEKVAFSLKEGGSGIAKTQAGYYVIRVEQKKEARLRPLREVREQARQRALQKKARETLKHWVTKLREASVIQIDDQAISRAVVAYEEALRQKPTSSRGETGNREP